MEQLSKDVSTAPQPCFFPSNASWLSPGRSHRTTTLRSLDELLQAYDMKRNLVELNYEAAQWKHKAVWNRRYMEAKRGQGLIQMWNEHEIDITKKTSNSREVRRSRRVVV